MFRGRLHRLPPRIVLLLKVLLRPTPVTEPAYEASRTVLRERFACLPRPYGDISVRNCRRRYEDGAAGGELDDQLPIPENQMAALLRIVIAERVDGAHRPDEIVEVAMDAGENCSAQVEGDGGP